MRRSAVFAVLAVAALIGGLVWIGTDDDAASDATTETVEIVQPAVTRADTRATRAPVARPTTIHGMVVRGGEGSAVTGHPVELLHEANVVARTTTDDTGEFAFRAVEPNTIHEVRTTAEGCHTVRITGLALLPGERRHIGSLLLYEPRVVRVTVTDEHGAPVSDAVVDVYREAPNALAQYSVGTSVPPPVPIETVQVDEQGDGELHLGYRARHAVVAHAPGYAPAVLPQVEIALVDVREERLRLVLCSPATLTGTVVDFAGEPVPGATVHARPPPRYWGRHGERALSAAGWQMTTADDGGAFRLDALTPGPVEVRCASEGGLPCGERFIQLPDVGDVKLVLDDRAAIDGTARTVAGQPLAGVTVRTANDANSMTVVTGADGRWSTPGLPAGELVHVDVIPPAGWLGPRERGNDLQPGGVTGGWYQKRLGAGQRLVLDVTFERASTVTGRVTVDGAPEPGGWVRAVTLYDGTRRARSDTTRADARGDYRLRSVSQGRVVVYALPASVDSDDTWSGFSELWEERFEEDGAAAAAAVDISEGSTTRIDVEAALPDGFAEEKARSAERRTQFDAEMDDERIRIVGRVTTEDGVPLRNALVIADEGAASESEGSRFAFDVWNTVQVGADGRFDGTVWMYGDPEQIHMSATDARHGIVTADAVPVESADMRTYRCDLELPVLPTFSGRVVHAGQPVENADVRANGAVVARTDDDGAFRIPYMDRGVSIRADGFMTAHEVLDELPDGDPVVIELVPSGSLAGIITDGSGHPVAGIRVLPVDADDDPIEGYAEWEHFASRPTPVTGDDGRFRVDHVPTRGVYLRITSADRDQLATAPFVAGPFDIADGDATIVVRRPRRLTGRVVGPGGEPVGDVSVRCVPSDPAAETASTRSDASGEFAVTSLQSGAYAVAAIPGRDSGLQPALAEVSEDQSHVELALARSVYISGTARWRDGSPFGPSLRLEPLDPVPPALGGQDLRIDPEDDGTFRVAATEGKRYAIEVYLRHWKGAVEVSGGEQVLAGTKGVVITATRVTDGVDPDAVSAGRVAGIIVNTGGEPIAGADVRVCGEPGSEQQTLTGADGRFEVTGMDPEAGAVVSVVAFADGRGVVQLDDVKIGDTRVRLPLPIERTIAGRMLTPADEPAVGYSIRALRTSNPVHDLWRADVDAEGHFELTGLYRGAWTLDAIDPRGNAIHLGVTRAGRKKLIIRLPE